LMISGSITSFSSISLTLGAITSCANRLTTVSVASQADHGSYNCSPVSRSISSSSVKFHKDTGVSIAGRVISCTPRLIREAWRDRVAGRAARRGRRDRRAGRNMVRDV
jgi:hypothetical protein